MFFKVITMSKFKRNLPLNFAFVLKYKLLLITFCSLSHSFLQIQQLTSTPDIRHIFWINKDIYHDKPDGSIHAGCQLQFREPETSWHEKKCVDPICIFSLFQRLSNVCYIMADWQMLVQR